MLVLSNPAPKGWAVSKLEGLTVSAESEPIPIKCSLIVVPANLVCQVSKGRLGQKEQVWHGVVFIEAWRAAWRYQSPCAARRLDLYSKSERCIILTGWLTDSKHITLDHLLCTVGRGD